MKIVVLAGSPNRSGSTAMLVEPFCKGAEGSGHTVEVLAVCDMNILPCTGCVACRYEGNCVQRDDNHVIRRALLASGMVVWAVPLCHCLVCRHSSRWSLTVSVPTTAVNRSLHRRHPFILCVAGGCVERR